SNPTHVGREMDDHIGLGLGQQGADRFHLAQIIISTMGDDNLCRFASPEILDHKAAQKSGSTSDDNTFSLPKFSAIRPIVAQYQISTSSINLPNTLSESKYSSAMARAA